MCHARHAPYHRAARRSERDVPRTLPRRDVDPMAGARRPDAGVLSGDPALRVSDAERESAVTLLREHGAAGRLDVAELEQRVAGAYAARTRGDLRALLLDLPAVQIARPATAPSASRDRLGEGWPAFVVVNVILIVVWALSGAGYFWPAWVIGSWALALVLRTG